MIIDSAPDGGVSSPQPSDERGIDVRVEVTVGRNPSERLDKLLVDRGLVQSRERARALILAGKVSVNGQRTDKVGCRVATDAEVQLERPDHPYVSRGALKLVAALDGLGIDPTGRRCLDVGASTGGFTDVLLRRGAAAVTAIDVGYGQLDWSLRSDPRVTSLERTNFRHLKPGDLPRDFSLITIDVSFISLELILPVCLHVLVPGGQVLAMCKPQFEVGKGEVGSGGVVRDDEKRRAAIDKVIAVARQLGFTICGEIESPVHGPKGNIETFIWLRTSADVSTLEADLLDGASRRAHETTQE
ncbi:MAG: TlyA family RNA methyltransferase [Myxococcales bacterium]|nr:TlyA family RNA methyltransferase [Myxococcales bacterium]